MNNGIAVGLALICLLLLIVLFKWVLNEFQFFQALIAGLNQDSDNQWKVIHQLQERPCPILGGTHGPSKATKAPNLEETNHAADTLHTQNS